MALDLALLARAQASGEGVWRCYTWRRPTISFGRNERVRDRFDADSVQRAGYDAVRRPTGGRALLHAREVTYSVTMPLARSVPWQLAYEAVNAILLSALHTIGVPASTVDAHAAETLQPDGPLCFDQPAFGEILLAGAKLVGSAVWREGDAYLQHGSILLHDDQAGLLDAMVATEPTQRALRAPPAAAGLAAWSRSAGRSCPDFDGVADALEHALGRNVGARGSVAPLPRDASVQASATREERRLSQASWLWRR